MKNLKASLAIGACLVLSSYGVAFAGQPGTTAGNNCGSNGLVFGPGGSTGTPNPVNPHGAAGGSPFSADLHSTAANPLTKGYAGNSTNPTGTGMLPNSTHAVSQYDIACFNVTPH